MEVVPDYIKLLSYTFIFFYMLSVGLETTRGQMRSELAESKLTLPALLLNFILIPLVGLVLTSVIDLSPDTKTGVLILSFSPGGLFALNFARVSKGNIHIAVALIFLVTLPAIVITPLLVNLFISRITHVGHIIRMILLLLPLVLIPIYLGRFLATRMSSLAKKLAKWIGTLSIGLFIVVTLLTSSLKSPAMKSVGMNGLVALILLVVISWVLGWFLGGSRVDNKKVMAIATSLRNVGFCIPLVINEFPGTNVIVPIMAFSGISIPMNMLFSIAVKFLTKHHQTNDENMKEPIASNQ